MIIVPSVKVPTRWRLVVFGREVEFSFGELGIVCVRIVEQTDDSLDFAGAKSEVVVDAVVSRRPIAETHSTVGPL